MKTTAFIGAAERQLHELASRMVEGSRLCTEKGEGWLYFVFKEFECQVFCS